MGTPSITANMLTIHFFDSVQAFLVMVTASTGIPSFGRVETSLPSRSSRRWFAVETSAFLWCCIRAGIMKELMLANEEWDCWLVLTCTVAVRTEVTTVGHRATRDVRFSTEEQALREALHFRPPRNKDV